MSRKVIVVDDDRDARELMGAALRRRGYEVLMAANGLRLLSALRVDRPDLILLDVRMSWISGLDLCRSLKQSEIFGGIRVVFVSGLASPEDVNRGLACGAVDYITKPFEIAPFVRRVESVVGPP